MKYLPNIIGESTNDVIINRRLKVIETRLTIFGFSLFVIKRQRMRLVCHDMGFVATSTKMEGYNMYYSEWVLDK